MEIEIRGGADFKVAAARLRAASTAEQQKQYRAAVVKSAKTLQAGVREDVPQYMPVSRGYAGILAKSLKLSTSVLQSGVKIKAKASGKTQPREIGKLERGTLRAPSRRIPRRRSKYRWHAQAVPPGFFTKPITERADVVRKEIIKAMQEIATRIVG